MKKVLILICLGLISLTSSSQQYIDIFQSSRGPHAISACEDRKGGYVHFYQMEPMGFSRSTLLFFENKSEDDSLSDDFYEVIDLTKKMLKRKYVEKRKETPDTTLVNFTTNMKCAFLHKDVWYFDRDVNLSYELTREPWGMEIKVETDRLCDDKNPNICVQGGRFVFLDYEDFYLFPLYYLDWDDVNRILNEKKSLEQYFIDQ